MYRKITSVKKASVIVIEKACFYVCIALESITIPRSVVEIATYAINYFTKRIFPNLVIVSFITKFIFELSFSLLQIDGFNIAKHNNSSENVISYLK